MNEALLEWNRTVYDAPTLKPPSYYKELRGKFGATQDAVYNKLKKTGMLGSPEWVYRTCKDKNYQFFFNSYTKAGGHFNIIFTPKDTLGLTISPFGIDGDELRKRIEHNRRKEDGKVFLRALTRNNRPGRTYDQLITIAWIYRFFSHEERIPLWDYVDDLIGRVVIDLVDTQQEAERTKDVEKAVPQQ